MSTPLKKSKTKSSAVEQEICNEPPQAIVRIGKDEMNLVEHPFAILWQKEPDNSVMFYEWEQTHPVTGKKTAAAWTVAGDSRYGLPDALDERVYLVLMELTRNNGFQSPTAFFSRYELLKRLGWDNADQSYKRLQLSFNRLTGVTIHAQNAFWNPRSRSYMNTSFNVLDNAVIEAEKGGRRSQNQLELPVSNFTWAQLLYQSFQSGYIRSLDLGFALSLKGDIALRLYRYLDKKTYDGRPTFEIDVFNLCIGHLGMKPNIYPSKLKERLKPAHEELIARGFLSAVQCEKTRSGPQKSEKVCYRFGNVQTLPTDAIATREAPSVQGSLSFDGPDDAKETVIAAPVALRPATKVAAVKVEPQSRSQAERDTTTSEQQELLQRMQSIKVSPVIARELLDQWPASAIKHQLDCLAERKPRSKAATFVKSVREMWALPEEYVKRMEAQEAQQKRQVEQDKQNVEKARQNAVERQETARLEEENARLDAMWDQMDEKTRERIDAQVMGKLGVLGNLGRGGAAKTAFRRAALRELLEIAQSP